MKSSKQYLPTSIENTPDRTDVTVRLTDSELQVNSSDKEIRTVSIVTISGTTLLSDRVAGLHYHKNRTTPQGTYIISIIMEDGQTVNRKVIIE